MLGRKTNEIVHIALFGSPTCEQAAVTSIASIRSSIDTSPSGALNKKQFSLTGVSKCEAILVGVTTLLVGGEATETGAVSGETGHVQLSLHPRISRTAGLSRRRCFFSKVQVRWVHGRWLRQVGRPPRTSPA
ncbi:hypothetical protein HPB50_001375 [Hyalomma asiaticum]|uniref:Uncharacterized protein n=1 Tax=Hyalomma asiaticum TaxID=266040 RepID=A0ACB7RRA8_HYAAI|nr:hypothetical protein HPB50_001375 [Hyalomma asiaticum]